MSDSQLHDRVHEVLTEANTSSGSLVAGDGDDEAAETDLLETATEASDLLESADPDELLAAVGLDTLADGTEPESIPEAIARGEQENVAALQRLLHLAKLADRADDGSLEGAVGDLRKTIGERAESAAAAGAGNQSDAESTADEGKGETAERDDTAVSAGDDVAASEDEAEDESTGDLGDRLRSSMQSSFEEFGDNVAQLKKRLEAASDGTARSETANGDDESDKAAADTETGEDDEDEGLLGSGLGGDRDRGTASGGPSRHSTMAPPPSQRADMRGLVRHSTMPNKHG
ncbi:hypothetical protein E2L06_04605 [Haloterrigena sp. H1]|uniref:hypothetical protein n=1 Tax=Haloterrigena sp. H1 TaxID=2552943 RepID=UPI00110E1D34|nr:hypothetical protein [Haloterrigena sp. H1]TMT85910.1 hypothetical protein E2L06_04605 [Haloterrigena sp. H1]